MELQSHLPYLDLIRKIMKLFLFFAQYNLQCYKAIFYRNDTLDILAERLQIHRLDFNVFEQTTQLFFIGVNTNHDMNSNKLLIFCKLDSHEKIFSWTLLFVIFFFRDFLFFSWFEIKFSWFELNFRDFEIYFRDLKYIFVIWIKFSW